LLVHSLFCRKIWEGINEYVCLLFKKTCVFDLNFKTVNTEMLRQCPVVCGNSLYTNIVTLLEYLLIINCVLATKRYDPCNNQFDTQFFMYVYFCSLHVSGSNVSIIRRIIVSMRHLVYVTLCR